MTDEATAFVPGHVTAFFSAHPDEDPVRAGSRGAGVALSDGVRVTLSPASETQIRLDGARTPVEPAVRVLDALDVSAEVDAVSQVPLGTGFGVSGALALGTALAANEVFDCAQSENDLVRLAHVAEVESGTGLGDVVAQARGGIPIRLEPGAPGVGRLDAVPTRGRVEYISFGELSTAEVLGGDTRALTRAGTSALDSLRADPRLPTLMQSARNFARDAALLTDRVESTIEDVQAAGGEAAMAMLGLTVFALGTGLTDAGYDPEVCSVHPAGATLLQE